MCGMLLLMEHFNDWDLHAIVRSCSNFPHPKEPAASPHVAAVQEAEVEDSEPAPTPTPRVRRWSRCLHARCRCRSGDWCECQQRRRRPRMHRCCRTLCTWIWITRRSCYWPRRHR
uniref:Uncharacterized protein n=1 Tax=Arundo donax TaxID=35708 RepID=A0A0A8ZXT3_ARUDO